MPRIWTDDDKAEVLRRRKHGDSPKAIGAHFEVRSNAISKLLKRIGVLPAIPAAPPTQPTPQEFQFTDDPEAEDPGPWPRTLTDRLRAHHNAFDEKAPTRRVSRPGWVDKES